MCLLSYSAPICSCFIHCILFYTVFLCHFRESSINSASSGAGHWKKQEPSLVTLWIKNAQCYHQSVLLMLTDWRTCLLFVAQLDRPAVINAMVEPASLPDPDSPPLAYYTQCTVSGWGVTWLNSYQLSPELRSVDVNIFSNCEYYYYFRITDNMICAGSHYGGKDSCQVRHRAVVVFETTKVQNIGLKPDLSLTDNKEPSIRVACFSDTVKAAHSTLANSRGFIYLDPCFWPADNFKSNIYSPCRSVFLYTFGHIVYRFLELLCWKQLTAVAVHNVDKNKVVSQKTKTFFQIRSGDMSLSIPQYEQPLSHD